MNPFEKMSGWLDGRQSPGKPKFRLPASAVDAQCHVFGPGHEFPFAPERKIDVSKIDVSMNGIARQDRECFAAIREGREPNSSAAKELSCYQALAKLKQQLNANR